MTLFTVLATLSIILLCLFFYGWALFNSFVKARLQVQTDFSDIDIQIKRRASLIQNLADMVKGYAKHEKTTFEEVAKARSAVDQSKGVIDSAKAENMLTETLRSLFAVVEAYPKLQASENYKSLQLELKETENWIARYREEYNESVKSYNTQISVFPNLFFAAAFRFQQAKLFQSSDTADSKVEI